MVISIAKELYIAPEDREILGMDSEESLDTGHIPLIEELLLTCYLIGEERPKDELLSSTDLEIFV